MNYPDSKYQECRDLNLRSAKNNLFNGEIHGLHVFKVRGQWRFS
jgi:outer membrane protein assembly factor BamD (BamD/ComL family)